MGRSTFILNLSEDLVAELNAKIRENNYANSAGIAEWLKERGGQGSRASVHRYMQKLKEADGHNGPGGSYELAASLKSHSGDPGLQTLFQRLGEIEYQRDQILRQIRDFSRKHGDSEELVERDQ